MKIRKPTTLGVDKRRKHHHWQVTVYYPDNETFVLIYSDHGKAVSFADRREESPVVKMARVTQVS